MYSPFFIASIFLTSLALGAEEAVVHEISPQQMHRPPGYPANSLQLLGVAGKRMRLVYRTAEQQGARPSYALRVDRITATTRIPVLNDKAPATASGWAWEWTPPLTRGVVTYEIDFQEKPYTTILLEIRDPIWLKEQSAMLALMKWEAAGLTTEEISAITSRLGIRRIATITHEGRYEAFLRLTAHDATQSRRQVTWDQRHHDLVVWYRGAVAQDLSIRAPRWWISAEALATDQGLIRFLDLFTEPPIAP